MTDTDENVDDISFDPSDYVLDEQEIVKSEKSGIDSSTFFSYPRLSDNSTINYDILEFNFSYGYNCRKYFNLSVADPDTIIFSSGNFLNIFDVPSREITFRRSGLGGGIGHIRQNPRTIFPHFAVAENGNNYGDNPIVVIYEWPTMEIVCGLQGGSTKSFTNLDYSPDGLLLVSQAGEPDYLITIYDWPKHKILLRTKSYVNDVLKVKFSEFVPGQLTTCGIAHIKFWKMCRTFTGLKLKGEVGRFGKTEYSDILGACPMPDEKVISGCDWGNLLLWDAGLIKIEVMRPQRRNLHEGPIVQILYNEGEVWTISTDGHVKVWWYEKIDQADPPDEDRVIQMESSYDFFTPGISLYSIQKRYKDDPDDFQHFAQDGNGGLWIIDLNVDDTPEPAIELYKCHAGGVVDIAACPFSHYFCSLGVLGRFFVYDYREQEKVYEYKFPAGGTCITWIPTKFLPYSDQLIMGFDDGCLRSCILSIKEGKYKTKCKLHVIEVTKPHSKAVTTFSINPTGDVLVSGGADSTIFIFQLVLFNKVLKLVPIGFLNSPEIPSYITWKPGKAYTVLVGCLHGPFFEADVPSEEQSYTNVSFLLKTKLRQKRFVSYKSQIRRDIKIHELDVKKQEKVDRKRKEINKLRDENPGFEIDEELYLEDSETYEELEPLYIPEVPNDILWLQYTPENTIWISMTGYDAGYIYEYTIDQTDDIPVKYTMVTDADDVEISSFVYNYNREYIIFGMQDGSIRLNKYNKANFRDMSDYWTYSMHENVMGFIPKLLFSYDEEYFFSCGRDNNVFAYSFKPDDGDYIPKSDIKPVEQRTENVEEIEDDSAYQVLSLEEVMMKNENDRIMKKANEHKKELRAKILELTKRYSTLLQRNDHLPESQRIRKNHLVVDQRVKVYINTELEKKVALVRRKLANDLCKSDVLLQKLKAYYLNRVDHFPLVIRALRKDLTIGTLRAKRLSPALFNTEALVEMCILEEEAKGRPIERPVAAAKAKAARVKKEKELEYFLLNLSQSVLDLKLDGKFTRLLTKYRTRRAKWEARQEQWEDFMALQPVPDQNHPDDVLALTNAEKTIGDYKLKTSPDYKVAHQERQTTLKKYLQLLQTRRKQFDIRHDFSEKVYKLRQSKEEIRKKLEELNMKLQKVHLEIPENARKPCIIIPPYDPKEYPEKMFIPEVVGSLQAESSELFLVKSKHELMINVLTRDTAESELLKGVEHEQALNFFQNAELLKESKEVCGYTLAELSEIAKRPATPWELEMKAFRFNGKLFEQEEILHIMSDTIDDFDSKLENLQEQRAECVLKGLFADSFLYTIHQEMLILKNFEAHEGALTDRVNQRLTQVLDMQDVMDEIKSKIETEEMKIEKNREREKVISEQFLKSVHENKFADFLKKVFKKKYKPPKVKRDDESSSESSSSSSSSEESEDDAKSIDSRDFGIIKQDLNVCPKGCDAEIFDNTIALRTNRHGMEIAIKECQRTIESFKLELDINSKKMKLIGGGLTQSQDELESFVREKQRKINDVDCTVVLKLSQMQHLQEDTDKFNIRETLVFSKTTLSRLYRRIGELQSETYRLKSRHTLNVKHLTRMKADCKFMSREINALKQKIINLVKEKIGRTITMEYIDELMAKKSFADDIVNELQEAILRRMVHELRLSLMDIKSLYNAEINLWTKHIERAETEYAEILRENTAKLDLLGVLKKERSQLTECLQNQPKRRKNVEQKQMSANLYGRELVDLKEIVRGQRCQIDSMEKEILILKTKGYHVPPSPKKKCEDKSVPIPEPEKTVSVYRYPEEIGEADSEEVISRRPVEDLDARTPEEIAKEILEEFFEGLDVKLKEKSVENFIKDIIKPIISNVDIHVIVKEIIDNVDKEVSTEDEFKILSIAEILKTTFEYSSDYLLPPHEPQKERLSKLEIKTYVDVVVDDIIEDVKSTESGKFHVILCKVMKRSLEEIPLEFLDYEENVDLIAKKLSCCDCEGSRDSIDKVKLAEVMDYWHECTCGSKDTIDKVKLAEVELWWRQPEHIKIIIREILDRVYATGLDFISFIK